MAYSKMIAKATGYDDPQCLRLIEDNMRMNLSGLDHLSPRAFNRLAREAAECCVALGAVAAARWIAAIAKAGA